MSKIKQRETKRISFVDPQTVAQIISLSSSVLTVTHVQKYASALVNKRSNEKANQTIESICIELEKKIKIIHSLCKFGGYPDS